MTWRPATAVRACGRRAPARGPRLAGLLRGQTIVAFSDALLIGLALWVLGVPLVLPLAVLTCIGASR